MKREYSFGGAILEEEDDRKSRKLLVRNLRGDDKTLIQNDLCYLHLLVHLFNQLGINLRPHPVNLLIGTVLLQPNRLF